MPGWGLQGGKHSSSNCRAARAGRRSTPTQEHSVHVAACAWHGFAGAALHGRARHACHRTVPNCTADNALRDKEINNEKTADCQRSCILGGETRQESVHNLFWKAAELPYLLCMRRRAWDLSTPFPLCQSPVNLSGVLELSSFNHPSASTILCCPQFPPDSLACVSVSIRDLQHVLISRRPRALIAACKCPVLLRLGPFDVQQAQQQAQGILLTCTCLWAGAYQPASACSSL